MNPLKRLFKQTAVYGLTTIIGRLLNYLLVPLYTYTFPPEEYGIVTELYAYAVLLQIVLTYGMETGFFRFAEKLGDKDRVFSTALLSLFMTSSLFVAFVFGFTGEIANRLGYSEHPEYIRIFAVILATDAVSAIFFARLRLLNKVYKFAALKLLNIILTIGLNLYFILLCPYLETKQIYCPFYNPEIGVGYIFISNLIASVAIFILFLPTLVRIKFKFDFVVWRTMLKYSLPLLVTGLAGAVNEVADRIMLKFLTVVPEGVVDRWDYVMYQIGIYGANAKIAVIMMLFVQAFRYAAEPFFFSYVNKPDFSKVYATVMTYFIVLAMGILLFVMINLDFVKYFISPKYFEGLKVVFPLLMSRMLVGVFFILSFWYKLTDRTHLGMMIFLLGSVETFVLNYLFIPKFGYLACAWVNFTTYLTMVLVSYFWGKRYFKFEFEFGKIGFYLVLGFVILLIFKLLYRFLDIWSILIGDLMLMGYLLFFVEKEIGLKRVLQNLKFFR